MESVIELTVGKKKQSINLKKFFYGRTRNSVKENLWNLKLKNLYSLHRRS